MTTPKRPGAHIWPTRCWQLIFHSYSESSTFGRPGLSRSNALSTIKWQFHRFLLYSDSSYLADQVLADLPPPTIKWQFHRFLLWQLIFLSFSESSTFGRPSLGRSNPPSNGNFTDSYSDSSYFIPTLRAQHLADLPPPSNGNFTDSCSTLRAHIWQTKCWQISPNPSLNGDFTDSCSTLRAHIWQTKCWQIHPHNGNFTDCCSDSS